MGCIPEPTFVALQAAPSRKPRLLDLFSGIGGFSLGLERAGFETVAFCEIDPFCRRVLAKHWPEVPCYDDVRTLTADRLRADGITVDAICGGFPCQDISLAGLERGLDGERSGLWAEIARLAGELQPGVLIVENVTNLLAGDRGAWFGRVLGDLAALGYDAEWHSISAAALGAPHDRDRVWLVAYPHGNCNPDFGAAVSGFAGSEGVEWWRRGLDELGPGDGVQRCDSYAGIRREVHGIPAWAHRLKALGNAVVPQIAELIGRAILEAFGADSEPLHQPEQHHHGMGNGLLVGFPSADGSRLDPQETGAGGLVQPEAFAGGFEIGGGHSERAQLFGVDAQRARAVELDDPIPHRAKVALGGTDGAVFRPVFNVGEGAFGSDGGEQAADGDALLVGEGHIGLQRAQALLTSPTVSDNLSGVNSSSHGLGDRAVSRGEGGLRDAPIMRYPTTTRGET